MRTTLGSVELNESRMRWRPIFLLLMGVPLVIPAVIFLYLYFYCRPCSL